jgi:hypothetical protein
VGSGRGRLAVVGARALSRLAAAARRRAKRDLRAGRLLPWTLVALLAAVAQVLLRPPRRTVVVEELRAGEEVHVSALAPSRAPRLARRGRRRGRAGAQP